MRVVFILAAASACVAGPWIMLQRPTMNNKRQGIGYLDSTLTPTVMDCARRCSGYGACKSLFYVQNSGECQTHSALYTTVSHGLVETVSTVYYEKGTYSSMASSFSTSTATTTTTGITIDTTTQIAETTSTEPTSTVTPCVPTPYACPPISTTSFTHVVLPGCNESFSYRIFSDASRDFWQSKTKCEVEGGKMVSILTLAKMNFMQLLSTCIDYAPLDYWIDGLYNASTATWETTGGTHLPMSQGDFWDIGRPNESDFNGMCVWVGDYHNYYFDDYGCTGYPLSSKLRTICELN